jgi:diacylglycerol kinase family enzyme
VTADAMSPLKRLNYLPVIEKGKHLNLSCVIDFQARRLVIESESTIEYHTDGEYREAERLDIGIRKASFLFRY